MSANFGRLCAEQICNGIRVKDRRVIDACANLDINDAVVRGTLESKGSLCANQASVTCLLAKDPPIGLVISVDEKLTLGNGADGEGIAFNPNDGLLYHVSGISAGNQYFETIDRITLSVGSNLVAGDTYPGGLADEEIVGIAWYSPIDKFLVASREPALYSLEADGSASTRLGDLPNSSVRGFAVVGTKLYGAFAGSPSLLYDINPSTGAINSAKEVTLSDGTVIQGINGVAACPNTSRVYVIYKDPANPQGNRLLGHINISTAVITYIGDLDNKMAGMVFDPTGKLWLVSGDGADPSSTLYSITNKALCPTIPVKAAIDLTEQDICNAKNIQFNNLPGSFTSDIDAYNAGVPFGALYYDDTSGRQQIYRLGILPP